MVCERHNLMKWASCCAALAICLGAATPALAQKFARRSRPLQTAGAAKVADSTVVVFEEEPAEVEMETISIRPQPAQLPSWQQKPGRARATAARRYVKSQPRMQEVVFEEEPTLADSELIAPGALEEAPAEQVWQGDEEIIYDESGDFAPGGCSTCGDPLFDDHICGPGCNANNCPRLHPCDGICIPRHRVEEHYLFIGPQGFKGPLDRGLNGNFGFNEGVNFAGQFGRRLGLAPLGIGYQVGAMFVQSDFYGNQVNGLQTKGRDQQFVTAGLFRRARRCGLQGGAVFDYLHDNYYVKYNVGQVRAELSYLNRNGHEIGFFGAFHVRPGHGKETNNTLNTLFTQSFTTIDYYNLFYRFNLPNGSWGRLWGGATGNKGGMVGADFRMPLTNQWDLNGMFNFLIPGPGAGLGGQTREGWGMNMNLAWYPGRPRVGVHNGYYRSLFNVANNGLMFVQPR